MAIANRLMAVGRSILETCQQSTLSVEELIHEKRDRQNMISLLVQQGRSLKTNVAFGGG